MITFLSLSFFLPPQNAINPLLPKDGVKAIPRPIKIDDYTRGFITAAAQLKANRRARVADHVTQSASVNYFYRMRIAVCRNCACGTRVWKGALGANDDE